MFSLYRAVCDLAQNKLEDGTGRRPHYRCVWRCYCNNLIVYIYRVKFIASVVYVELYSMHGIKVIQTYSGLSMRY